LTICIGALCTDRVAGDTVVLASDRMVTWRNLTEFEHPVPKIYSISPAAWALCAGDALAGAKIIAGAAAEVAGVPRPVHEVADVVAQQYHSVRMNAAEAQVLLPRGLTLASYYGKHQQLLSQIAENLDQSLASFDPEVELIVAGVDSSGGHLFTVSNPGGSAECHDVIGTVAIGSGEIHAVQSMIGFGHAATRPVRDTVFYVFASKRRAELAPGVGRDTDLMVLSPGGAVRLPDKALAKLGELYESYAASVVASAREQVSGWAFDLAADSADPAAAGGSADQILPS
jgi:20S proteasome alpha/beta subunit